MVIHWPFLIVGVLCLCFPRQWMRLGRVVGRRRKSQKAQEPWKRREPGDPRISFALEFSKSRNYFDLLRGTAGGLAIMGWREIPESLSVAEPVQKKMVWVVFGVKLAILLCGLLVQIVRRENTRITYFAAIFYLAGVSVALVEPWGALFSFVLIWAINPMLPNAQSFLSAYALLLLGFGYLLGGTNHFYPLAAGLLCFLPALLSWMTRRPLVVFSRKAFHPGTDAT